MLPCNLHAAARLLERYGLDLTPAQFAGLQAGFADPWSRLDTTRLRLQRIGRVAGRPSTTWLVNLEAWKGAEEWALAVFDEERKRLVTFLPPPKARKHYDILSSLAKKASRGGRRKLPPPPAGRARGRPRGYPGGREPDWLADAEL